MSAAGSVHSSWSGQNYLSRVCRVAAPCSSAVALLQSDPETAEHQPDLPPDLHPAGPETDGSVFGPVEPDLGPGVLSGSYLVVLQQVLAGGGAVLVQVGQRHHSQLLGQLHPGNVSHTQDLH